MIISKKTERDYKNDNHMGYPKDEEYMYIPERIKRADIEWV